MTTYGELLRSHREVINRLNVYPVPDGDTGTNMALTVESVITALAALDERRPMGEVAQAIAHGSLMGARGNSGRHPLPAAARPRGVISRADGEVDRPSSPRPSQHADELARQAVVRPVEGTILSIARAAAAGAQRARGLDERPRRAARATPRATRSPRPPSSSGARPGGRRRQRGHRTRAAL